MLIIANKSCQYYVISSTILWITIGQSYHIQFIYPKSCLCFRGIDSIGFYHIWVFLLSTQPIKNHIYEIHVSYTIIFLHIWEATWWIYAAYMQNMFFFFLCFPPFSCLWLANATSVNEDISIWSSWEWRRVRNWFLFFLIEISFFLTFDTHFIHHTTSGVNTQIFHSCNISQPYQSWNQSMFSSIFPGFSCWILFFI